MSHYYRQFAEPDHDRAKRAHALLRASLPDRAPFSAWTNFEFVALDGGAFDVDALVFTPHGIFLVELATHRGTLHPGARTWVHTHQNGQREAFDTPLLLAQRKARLLRTLLDEYIDDAHAPHIEPVVWITEPDVAIEDTGQPPEHVVFHPDARRSSFIDLLQTGSGPSVRVAPYELTNVVRDRFATALVDAGIGPSTRHRRYGDWRLCEILHAAPRHQDWLVEHVSRKGDVRRARIFSTPRAISDHALARLQEAARREFEILAGLRHPSILAARQHIRSERQPGLLFEHPDGAVRLDHWLDAGAPSVGEKLDILLQVAEALRYAHRKHVIHRALNPGSVLVLPDGSVRVFNWHTSRRENVETGTVHVHDYMDDVARAYLAPELAQNPLAGEQADVYGIGAIAFRLFAGAAPAATMGELVDVLVQKGGLRPSRLTDGIPEFVDDFVFDATRVLGRDRLQSMTAVIDRIEQMRLALVHRDVTNIDPLEAGPGDVLDGRFEIVRRVGAGSTATAFLARTSQREVVLKIANADEKSKRLRAEAAELEKFDHKLVVNLIEVTELHGRLCLVLQNAGETLRARLRDRALSLDELGRFGEDLCEILIALEERAVLHRDIKPANLGIGQPSGGLQRLMIFDFSLADVPLDALNVGTDAYRDPLLPHPERRRWDEYADRYSAALTLYEMVATHLPQWGTDGPVNAIFADETAQCHIEAHLFPASVREPLQQFFQRAFRRNHRERFDNALDMRDAWRAIFERTTQTIHDAVDDRIREATFETAIASLGLSPVAQDALDRLDVVTVRDLIDLKPQDLQFQKGIANAIRKELAELRARLVDHVPFTAHLSESSEADEESLDSLAVDQILERLTGEPSKNPKSERDFIAALLGQAELQDALPWASLDVLARRSDRDLGEFHEAFHELQRTWERKRVLAPLRDDIVRLIENSEGAISDAELARRILGLRGSNLRDGEKRIAAAAAVARAAVEGELVAHEPRLFLARTVSATFVLTRDELSDVLQPLGNRADALVKKDHVLGPDRAIEALQKVLDELGVAPLSQHRLLTIATEASRFATLSSRNELYLRGLAPERSLALCAGIFVAGAEFRPEEIQERVASRYPAADPLPGHPGLGALLQGAGLKFYWDTARRDGTGAYVNRELDGFRVTRSTLATSLSSGSTLPPSEGFALRKQFSERLEYKLQYGGFLAITTDVRDVDDATRWLLREHPALEHVSMETLLIDVLREKVRELGASWDVVLAADADDGEEQNRLLQLLHHRVFPTIRERLLSHRGDLLVTEPGIFARYEAAGAMTLLDELHEHSGTEDGPRAVFVLIPGDRTHATPDIDGRQIAVLHPTEYCRFPASLS